MRGSFTIITECNGPSEASHTQFDDDIHDMVKNCAAHQPQFNLSVQPRGCISEAALIVIILIVLILTTIVNMYHSYMVKSKSNGTSRISCNVVVILSRMLFY